MNALSRAIMIAMGAHARRENKAHRRYVERCGRQMNQRIPPASLPDSLRAMLAAKLKGQSHG